MITVAGMGPPPKPNARRRNASGAMTQLPAGGRDGAPPPWPLRANVELTVKRDEAQRSVDDLELELAEPDLSPQKRGALQRKLDAARTRYNIAAKTLEAQEALESEQWAELWATPQAVAWERLKWTREVAQYVRWKSAAELGDLEASKEARMLSDRLGLTPQALLRLRWAIAEDEVTERRRPARAARPASGQEPPDDPRGILHVVG